MTQFGAGTQLAAQCQQAPTPDGWREWLTDSDGPVPDALAARATAIAADQTVPLGTTESYPLPGVTTMIRVEPRVWGKDASGAPVQGCFRSSIVYLPVGTATGAGITAPTDTWAKPVEILDSGQPRSGNRRYNRYPEGEQEMSPISHGGCAVPGFSLGEPPRPSECACRKVLGIGDDLTAPAAVHASPWTVAIVTSVVGAATGWVIEEFARHVRSRGQS